MLITLGTDEWSEAAGQPVAPWSDVAELPAVPRVGDTIQVKGAGWTVDKVVWTLGEDLLAAPVIISVILVPWHPRKPVE